MADRPRGRYTDTINAYKNFITRQMACGYSIFWDGCFDPNDSEIWFVIKITDINNLDAKPKYAFYRIFTGAPLSAQGFEDRKDDMEFAKMVKARVAGCTLTRSEIIYGLIGSEQYEIEDIYDNGKLILNKKKIEYLTDWINFKGGMHPRERVQHPRGTITARPQG